MKWECGVLAVALVIGFSGVLIAQQPTPVEPPVQEEEKSVVAPPQNPAQEQDSSKVDSQKVAPGPTKAQADDAARIVEPPKPAEHLSPESRIKTYPIVPRSANDCPAQVAQPVAPQWVGSCCLIQCLANTGQAVPTTYQQAGPNRTGQTQIVRQTVTTYGPRSFRQSRAGGSFSRAQSRGRIPRRFRR